MEIYKLCEIFLLAGHLGVQITIYFSSEMCDQLYQFALNLMYTTLYELENLKSARWKMSDIV